MVTILADGWMIIEEDCDAESIIRVDSICIITGDDEIGFSLGLVNGESYDFEMTGGFSEVSRKLVGHTAKSKGDGETYGRVPV